MQTPTEVMEIHQSVIEYLLPITITYSEPHSLIHSTAELKYQMLQIH